jgi:type II secretory pathway predicted ATPase ExeA
VYLNFYGLREEPFGVTPDPRFLFFGDRHREALASLNYGIHTARGFIALIAKPGMGKTTLLFEMLNRWSDGARTAFLFQTQCDARELKRYLLAELGVKNVEYDFVRQQDQLHEVLQRETRLGRRVVIVIDEAQNLRPDALETVRLLSNFETQSSKLLHIVLAGQPQLAERLAAPALLQLRQRIAMWRKLEPFTSAEVRQYMNHRLQVAGHQGGPLFNNEAQQLVAECSQGVPRTINHLCFSALSIGCALGKRLIDGVVMQEVIEDQNLEAFLRETESPAARTLRVPSHQAEEKRTAVSTIGIPQEGGVAPPSVMNRASAPVLLAQPVKNLGDAVQHGNAVQHNVPQSVASSFAAGIKSAPRTQTRVVQQTSPSAALKANGAPQTNSDFSLHYVETKWLEERSRMTRPLQLHRTHASIKPAQPALQNPAVKRAQTDKHQLAAIIRWLTGR